MPYKAMWGDAVNGQNGLNFSTQYATTTCGDGPPVLAPTCWNVPLIRGVMNDPGLGNGRGTLLLYPWNMPALEYIYLSYDSNTIILSIVCSNAEYKLPPYPLNRTFH